MKKRRIAIAVIIGLIAIVGVLTSCMISVEIEGDYVEPDRLYMNLFMELNGEPSPAVEVIKVGDEIYVKDPDTGQWMSGEDVEEYEDYAGLEEFALGSKAYILAFEGSNMLGDEEINGVMCYHVKGYISPEKMVDAAQELIPTDTEPLTAELWIGIHDYLVHQMIIGIELEEASESAELPISAGTFTFTYQFSKHNEPITIEAPSLAD